LYVFIVTLFNTMLFIASAFQ